MVLYAVLPRIFLNGQITHGLTIDNLDRHDYSSFSILRRRWRFASLYILFTDFTCKPLASATSRGVILIESKSYRQIKVQKDGVRKAFTSSLKGRKGKHEAEAKADEWLENSTEQIRFPAAWNAFMEVQRNRTGTANVSKLEQINRLYIAPKAGERRLSGITPIMWQSCIDTAAQKGLSARTCTNIRAAINEFVGFALRSRWNVQRLEKGDLVIPKNAAARREKIVLQPYEIRVLFSDACFPRYGRQEEAHFIHAWRFLVATGLRRGEMCGLRTEDIDGRTLTICRSINSENEITEGKNRNARRTIELTDTALKVLADQRAMLQRKALISPWVFCDRYGERPSPNCVYDQWDTYRKHHGIRSNLHELRHTFISINKADLPLELMKSVVGHSESMDTFGVYGHEIEGERHRAATIIDGVFRGILNDTK